VRPVIVTEDMQPFVDNAIFHFLNFSELAYVMQLRSSPVQ
jgi:hypothetical protein